MGGDQSGTAGETLVLTENSGLAGVTLLPGDIWQRVLCVWGGEEEVQASSGDATEHPTTRSGPHHRE